MTEPEAIPVPVAVSLTERRCVVTRESAPKDRLLRFVLGPDNAIVFDLKQNLPGRGAWVKAARQTLELAVRRKALVRALDQPTFPDADFAACQQDGLQWTAQHACQVILSLMPPILLQSGSTRLHLA